MRYTLTTTTPIHAPRDLARSTLRLNGLLLLVAGLAALSADLIGYHFAAGPFAGLAGQPLAIGAVEAHGLAALVGLLLLRGAKQPQRWGWHLLALSVHLFLGVCNLRFWPVYALIGASAVGVVSTAAHALLASAQLACLARAGGGEPLPGWLRSARAAGLYARGVAVGTLLLGAGAHIAVILLGREGLPRIITPAFELLLTVPMCYVSVAGWLAWPSFQFRGRWHRAALAAILVYFPVGIPFHVITVVTGSTAHYAAFPEQYSLLIVPVMGALIACLAALRLREPARASQPQTSEETQR